MRDLPAEALREHVLESRRIEVPANRVPWIACGMQLRRGEAFSVYAEGRVVLSEEAGLWNGARRHLWARVGGRGPLLNGTQDAYTFSAPHDGALELGVNIDEWLSRDGDCDAAPHAVATGGFDVLVVRWAGDPSRGAAALAAACPEELLFAAEAERLAAPPRHPEGWRHLWFLGETDIFESATNDDGPSIRIDASDDVGILQKPVDFAFTPDTRLLWRWRVDQLPSAIAEDSLPTHDYLSIAVEFENGQDLTYYWSAALPADSHFRCPLPHWDQRETHWVVRSGLQGLGEWHAEERPLYRDYEIAVGPAPTRVVAVWLIAVSIFQKQRGIGEFAALELVNQTGRVRVF